MKLIKVLCVAAMSLSLLSACSSDDDPAPAKTGEEIAARYKSLLTPPMSESWMFPTDNADDNKYMAVSTDAASAHKLCVALIGDEKWTPASKTYILPDKCGNVAVIDPETEGVYYTLSFNVKDLAPTTLEIVSPEYLANHSNMGQIPTWLKETYKCENCGWLTMWWQGECPLCGCTTCTHF